MGWGVSPPYRSLAVFEDLSKVRLREARTDLDHEAVLTEGRGAADTEEGGSSSIAPGQGGSDAG